MFDFSHPWYQPLSHRIGTVAACAIWFGMEVWMRSPFWMILAGSATGFTLWKLILTFKPHSKD